MQYIYNHQHYFFNRWDLIMNLNRKFIYLAVMASISPPLANAADALKTDKVEVISNTPLPGTGISISKIPSNVQTVKSEDIRRVQALDLSEYMNRQMGSVYINDIQNNPLMPDVNYRGFTASPLLGTPQGISIYMDGVRMNLPFGDQVNWDLIPRNAIQGMQLMPGSNPMFGLNTLGGAISIQTKDGRSNPGSSVQFTLGSYNRKIGEFEHGGVSKDGSLDYFIAGTAMEEDGWRDKSQSNYQQLFGKLGWHGEKTDLKLTYSFADTDLNGNGLVPMAQNKRDYRSVFTYPDNTRNNSNFLNLQLAHYFTDNVSFTGNAYYKRVKTRTYNGDINDESLPEVPGGYGQSLGRNYVSTGSTGNNCLAQLQAADEPGEKCPGMINRSTLTQISAGIFGQVNVDDKIFGLNNIYTVGGGFERSIQRFGQTAEFADIFARQAVGYGYFANGLNGDIDGEPDDRRTILRGRSHVWSLYATDTLSVTDALSLTASARYNHVRVDNNDHLIPEGQRGSLSGEHHFNRVNPALGLTYKLSESLNVYGGYNEGSRAPTSIELGCADPESPCRLPNAMAGDPPLKQVVTKTWETGIRGSLGSNMKWNAGVFHSRNENDIMFVSAGSTSSGYFKNFGETKRQGFEGGFSGKVDNFSFGANYTFIDATYQSEETVGGNFNSSAEVTEVDRLSTSGITSATASAITSTSNTNLLTPTARQIHVEKGDKIPLIPRNIMKAFAVYDINENWSLGGDAIFMGGQYARGNENNKHKSGSVTYDCQEAADDDFQTYIKSATPGSPALANPGSPNITQCNTNNNSGSFLNPGKIAGYAVFNMFSSYKIDKEWTLFARVNNIFDREFYTAAQLGGDPFSNNQIATSASQANRSTTIGDTFVAPGAPRSGWVGIRWDFDAPK